jgi:uncharacterized membrane protein
MDTALRVLALLPWDDWLALVWFFLMWGGYAAFARRRGQSDGSLLELSNRIRRRWMAQATRRENRVLDAIVIQNLSSSTAFFASTTILIIGGLIAALGAGEQTAEMVRELPFAARTSEGVFDLKLMLLTGIFVHAFFRFTWSMRQYSFVSLLVAALAEREDIHDDADRERFASQAGTVAALAAESFNDGLRAYYLSFAAVSWFLSPLAFAVGTAGVVYVLYQREFRSTVVGVLRG